MQLLDRVRQTIRRHGLADARTRVAIAISGGSDSVALSCILRELAASGDLQIAGLAHFNHQLRPEAGADERFCAALAGELGFPIVVDTDDVAARARREQRSIEDAARAARYEFFERARDRLEADVVALGHTRDDQAETFLLRLVRGAGPRGLASMRPRNGSIVRPLIDCRRADLREYLNQRQARYVEDASNDDVSIPRNRVRAELIPLLASRFNPAIVDVLADAAELARDEWTWMVDAAREFEAREGELDVTALLDAPLALRRVLVWSAMSGAAGGRPVGFEHVEAALQLLEPGGDGSGVDAPGHRVQRFGGRLVLTRKGSRGSRGSEGSQGSADANFFRYQLSIPGEVRLPQTGVVVSAEPRPALGSDLQLTSVGGIAVVRSDACAAPLAVRTRRPGDRFQPLGAPGRRKLQDFFVDRKVSRHERDAVPLVVDRDDRIVWVAGYAIDDQFRVTDPAQAVLILRLRQA